jgi:hypothetical protein
VSIRCFFVCFLYCFFTPISSGWWKAKQPVYLKNKIASYYQSKDDDNNQFKVISGSRGAAGTVLVSWALEAVPVS